MSQFVQLNYEELHLLVKAFRENGEDYASLFAVTRQKVHDLESEWIGEGADKFFDEMETELLPALNRVSQALFFSQNVLLQIIKIIHEADEETVKLFKGDLNRFSYIRAPRINPNLVNQVGGNASADDFGAGLFNDVLKSGSGEQSPTGVTETAGVGANSSETGSGNPAGSSSEPVPAGESGNQASSGGGSGGGSTLGGTSGGLGTQSSGGSQGAGGNATGNAQTVSDHIYSPTGATENSDGTDAASGTDGALTAGAAGLAGASAVGGMAKKIRNKKNEQP